MTPPPTGPHQCNLGAFCHQQSDDWTQSMDTLALPQAAGGSFFVSIVTVHYWSD